MNETEPVPPGVDPAKPSPARMHDFCLGGTANYQSDRDAVARILEVVPETKDAAWANRGFLQRAVTWMARRGISQFLDLGAGLPTQRNTHEVARTIVPDARVVYTDNDPSVIAHGHQIMVGTEGVAVIEADFRRPEQALDHPETRRLIDFSQPTGLFICAVTQFIADGDDPWGLVARYLTELAPGSYMALSAPTADHAVAPKVGRVVSVYSTSTAGQLVARTKTQVSRFFYGLRIVPPYPGAQPALTSTGLWGCVDPQVSESDGSRAFYAAVARKPAPDEGFWPDKPTAADLGIEVTEQAWRSPARGPGAIEMAFAGAAGQEWVLLRLRGEPDRRVSVLTRREWDGFLDGVRNGKFDGTAT